MQLFSIVQEIINLPIVEAAWEVEYTSQKGNGWSRMDETVVQVDGIKYLLYGAYDIAGSGSSQIQTYWLPGEIGLNWSSDNKTSVSSTPSSWNDPVDSEWAIKQTQIK